MIKSLEHQDNYITISERLQVSLKCTVHLHSPTESQITRVTSCRRSGKKDDEARNSGQYLLAIPQIINGSGRLSASFAVLARMDGVAAEIAACTGQIRYEDSTSIVLTTCTFLPLVSHTAIPDTPQKHIYKNQKQFQAIELMRPLQACNRQHTVSCVARGTTSPPRQPTRKQAAADQPNSIALAEEEAQPCQEHKANH